MINNTVAQKFVAVVMAAVILLISSQVAGATPGVRRAALSVLGAVEINGERVISGGTFFSDSAIVTHEQSAAVVNLGGTGRVALSANSILRLSFTDAGLNGWLDAGEARVSIPAGVSVSFVTPGRVVRVAGSESTSFIVTTQNGITEVATTIGSVELTSEAGCTVISAEDGAVARGLQNQPSRGPNRKALVAWLVAIGGGIAAAVWVVTHDSQKHEEDMTFGGTVIIPSG